MRPPDYEAAAMVRPAAVSRSPDSWRGRAVVAVMALVAAGLWFLWPLLRPLLWPARGPAWLVVLDGYHRLDAALLLQRRHRLPILLISCPATGQPTATQWRHALGPLLLLRQGFDTASQIAALANWSPPGAVPGQPLARVWIVSDDFHVPRAALAAQVALGARGTRVDPLPVARNGRLIDPIDAVATSSPVRVPLWPIWRDALRLQLWRLSGSTGAFLNPTLLRHKQRLCKGAGP